MRLSTSSSSAVPCDAAAPTAGVLTMTQPYEAARQPTDEQLLLTRLRRGDRAAVGEVYDAHQGVVQGFARRLTGDPAAAQDLVHEVFVALPGAVARFRGESTIRTLLLSMVVNHARHHLRSASRRRAAMERFAREAPREGQAQQEPQALARDLARELSRALDALPLDQRAAFVLCEIEERSAKEVGLIVGAPEAPVRTRVFHAKRKLREELDRRGIV